jgi:hypothetical protein
MEEECQIHNPGDTPKALKIVLWLPDLCTRTAFAIAVSLSHVPAISIDG